MEEEDDAVDYHKKNYQVIRERSREEEDDK
jgi:hypothetical protein